MTMSRHAPAALIVLLSVAAVACSDSVTPALPSVPTPPSSVPATPPSSVPATPPSNVPASTAAFPALSRAGDVYQELGTPYASAGSLTFHNGLLASRFILYRDGTFGLQFVSGRFGFFEYGGSYVRADSSVALTWDGWSTAGTWGTTVTARGDTLRIAYNQIMALSDFVDASYVRVAATP
jgi:hypothetical protein